VVRDGKSYLPGTSIAVLKGLDQMLVPIAALRPDVTNPRTQVNIESLMDGIRQFGMRWPIVVNERTGIIEAGHQRMDALKRLGAAHVPVIWADDDRATARAFMIADNRYGEIVATWDETALTALLRDLHDEREDLIKSLGFEDDELTRLLAGEGAGSSGNEPPPREDLSAQLQVKWGTRVGDIWGLWATTRCPKCGKVHDLEKRR
jgi:ParB-like chromosome segregation protein Spo0J